jgi:hypothetical protein
VSRSDIEDRVWGALSARKWLVGRRACNRLTRRTIRAWDRDVPRLSRIEDQVRWEATQDMQLGIIATWLLSALVAEVVQLVWEWFTSNHAAKVMLYAYQRELSDDEC